MSDHQGGIFLMTPPILSYLTCGVYPTCGLYPILGVYLTCGVYYGVNISGGRSGGRAVLSRRPS